MANSVPTLAGLLSSVTFAEDTVSATPQLLDADVTFTDLDNDVAGATLTVSGLLAEDIVSIRNQGTGSGEIGFSGTNVTYDGNVIGLAAGGAGGTLSVVFTFGATAAAVDALIQNLTYANVSDAPAASRAFEIKITDSSQAATIAPVTFAPLAGTANPFNGIVLGDFSAPSFADLDGDGDPDLVAGDEDGVLHIFENRTLHASAPDFTPIFGPFNGINVRDYSTPSFADLDADGDLDAVLGAEDGMLHYFRNIGTVSAPLFAGQTGAANPFDGVNVGLYSAPVFADLDHDGDLDAIVGVSDGTIHYFRNTGTASAPVFAEQTGVANPFDGVDVGRYSNPSFADLDRDGDLDAVVGEDDGTLRYFENTGSAIAPAFMGRTGANPFNDASFDVGTGSAPTFADLDRDGDLDVVVGELSGVLNTFENTTPHASAPGFTQIFGAANPFNGFDVGTYSAPSFADLDADGDLDAVVGGFGGRLRYFGNAGTASAPSFAEQTGASSPFDGIDVGFYSTPTFADLDADGDLDAVVGAFDGTIHYFGNTGTASAPSFAEQTGAANPFDSVDVGFFSTPTFADLDSDGDLDAVVGAEDGTIHYFRNTGTASAPVFAEQTGVANPFDGVDIGVYSNASFTDLDHDGDLDAVVGSEDGVIHYFGNTGTAYAPVFAEQTGAANPFDGVDIGFTSTPAFADLDGDGDLDLVVGESSGHLSYFRNTGAGFKLIVNITAQNDAPALANAIADRSVAEDSAWSFRVAANAFSDVDGDTLTYTATLGNGAALPSWLNFDGITRTFSGTPPQDFNGQIELKVTASDGALTASDVLALTVTPVNDASTGTVTIAGTATEGQTLTASNTLSDADGLGIIGYQWQRNGADIGGATDATYMLGGADLGAAIRVAGHYTDGHGTAEAVTSAATARVLPAASKGTLGNDDFAAPIGTNEIDAGTGVDLITFGFRLVDATITWSGNHVIIDSASSHTVLTGFETYVFTDGTVSSNDGDPLVDDLFYYSQYHDVWNAHLDADRHYHQTGWHEGRDPSAFFSTSFYLSVYSDVKASGVDPLAQFDQSGWKEGRAPSLAFDGANYLAANRDVAAAHVDPLAHFLASGAQEGRQPFAVSALIAPNGFDYAYYLQHNPDVAAAHVDPFRHFETTGWKEGRNPNALFDTNGYLSTYTDVAAAQVNPLDHYHQNGWIEGRDPSKGFDTAEYLGHYPDAAAAHVDPLLHFLQTGNHEGRSPFADGMWG